MVLRGSSINICVYFPLLGTALFRLACLVCVVASLKLRITPLQNLRIVRRSKRNKIRKLYHCVKGIRAGRYTRPDSRRSVPLRSKNAKATCSADHCFATKYLSFIPPRAGAQSVCSSSNGVTFISVTLDRRGKCERGCRPPPR